MFCGKCGTEVADGNKFCSNCGSPMGDSAPNQASAGVAQNSAESNENKEKVY